MCARVSLSKFFAPSLRNSGAAGLRTDRSSELNPRKQIPQGWRSFPTLYGYPENPLATSVQSQIMNALHLGERGRAASLLSHIGDGKHSMRAKDFARILKYCALTPDPLFVMEIWRTMEEKGVDLNNKCHVLMIKALCKGGYIEEAFNLMSNCAETPDLYPTLSKYNTLLGASAVMQSLTHASKCLDLMEHDIMGKNEQTYIELLKNQGC